MELGAVRFVLVTTFEKMRFKVRVWKFRDECRNLETIRTENLL